MAILWDTPGSLTAYLSTTLNSLADETTDLGAAIDNSTAKKTFMDIELILASVDLSSQSNPATYIYLIESVDGGTNYDSGTDAASTDDTCPPVDKLCAIIGAMVGSGAQAHNGIKTMIPIPPGHFKLMLRNKTGAGYAASGNTLKYRTYSLT